MLILIVFPLAYSYSVPSDGGFCFWSFLGLCTDTVCRDLRKKSMWRCHCGTAVPKHSRKVLQNYEGPLRPRELYSLFYSDSTQILTHDGPVPESRGGTKGQPLWWFITWLLSCFMSLRFSLGWGPSCVVLQLLSELDYGSLCFHSDYCDIRDSNTWAAHCISGFDLHLLCILVTILSIQFCNIISFWSVLATCSVFLDMDEGHFEWVLNHVAYEKNEFWITLLMRILLPFLTNGNAAMYEAAQNGSDFFLYADFEALWENFLMAKWGGKLYGNM